MQFVLRTFILLAMVVPLHAGDVYTTTGAAGEKVYTDQPDPDARKLEMRSARAASEEEDAGQEAGPTFEEMSPCEQARFIVQKYDAAEVLAEKTADGETRILNEDETEAMKAQARADVERLCKEESDEQ